MNHSRKMLETCKNERKWMGVVRFGEKLREKERTVISSSKEIRTNEEKGL